MVMRLYRMPSVLGGYIKVFKSEVLLCLQLQTFQQKECKTVRKTNVEKEVVNLGRGLLGCLLTSSFNRSGK